METPDRYPHAMPSPFAVNNVRWFIAFRVFFNCRFYYPVFTILFLDFGLSMAQFSMLNAVWAATIVLAEVPSGALADIVGRRRLVVFAAASMLVEMLILCFAPRGNPSLLFLFFMVNRVLSGLAEASASGADEAIAYDALQASGMADQWGRVFDRQMRLRSIMFIFTMIIGAAVYDPALMTRAAAAVGWGHVFTQAETLRLPVYLTLVMAFFTLGAALRLDETPVAGETDDPHASPAAVSALAAFKLTLAAGGWILKTPFILAVILYSMFFDGILRMVVTLASQYYRMIQLPESLYGVLGSVMAVAGIFIPRLARWIAEHRSPSFCLWSTALTALAGLAGMACFWPTLGLIPALVTFSALYMVGFHTSYFINRETASARRATVLSFKGLACNLAYGLLGMLYAGLLEMQKRTSGAPHLSPQALDNQVFRETFAWFPVALVAGLILLAAGRLAVRKMKPER